MKDLDVLRGRINSFNEARDWSQFHSPKNLAMSLVIEAAELAEIFQWLSESDSHQLTSRKRQDVALEIGDVLIYLLNISDKLGIDPVEAALGKLDTNEQKYPVDKARGSADKYTEF